MNPLLLIFCKNPILGNVKTRLAKDIGAKNALMIYQKLLEHTAYCVKNTRVKTTVFYDNKVEEHDVWTAIADLKKVQVTGDLGTRMAAAFQWGFDAGYGPIVLIGSDLWELTANDIKTAFKQLISNDVVLGPATDGGYYLLGMQQMEEKVFQNMPWSTPQLWTATLAVLLNKTTAELTQKNDIDHYNDLIKIPELMALLTKE